MAGRPRYRAKPDANQADIVEELEDAFLVVVDVSQWFSDRDIFVWGYHQRLGEHIWTAWELKTEKGEYSLEQQASIAAGMVRGARSAEPILKEYGIIE